MNKRITSILLCLVMMFSMLATAVPALAASPSTCTFTVEADKSEAHRGDTITFTVYLQQTGKQNTLEFTVVPPEGLTYVANSATLGANIKETMGFDEVAWTEQSMYCSGFGAYSYEGTDKLTLLTFKCTVDDDAAFKTYEFGLVDHWADDETYSTKNAVVVPAEFSVVAKPVAVTGVTIDETLSVKTGESKTPSYTVNPAEATNKTVSFKSSDNTVATVNETTGKVTGVKEGTATITITTADGNFTDTCVVTVACSHTNKTPVGEKPSDCKNKGWDAYVKCDDCGQLFKSDGTAEIAEIPFRELSSNHTGGTATCTERAVCTVCGNSYGSTLDHSYTAETKKAEALKDAGNCRDKAVYYYSCSACGKVENNDSHTFLGDKVANNHVGGTALVNQSEANHKTQTDGYTGDTKCLGCGEIIDYGDPILAGAHTPANVWSTDGQYHWKECSVVGCGIVIDGSKAEHTSEKAENKAACGKQAVCDVCGVSYGNPISHSFTKEEKKETALKTAGDCGKEAVYIKSCVHCGQVDTDTDNTFRGEKDANNHANYGTYLDGVVDVDHKNGVDGYTGDKKCNECDGLIEQGQAIPAGAHVPADDWSTDSTHHWRECTVIGCGIVIDGSKAEHKSEKDENKAACGKQAVCDVCGVAYGEIPQHNYGTEKPEQPAEIGQTGLKAHYQCSECDKYFVDVEHDTHVEKKEVAYEDLIIPALVDNELTFEIPFSVVVKKTGDLDPAKETFTFKMFDLGYADTIFTVEGLTVETNGVNTYTGKLVIKVKESQFGNLSEGFKFAQVKGSADGWTYDETVYYIAPQISDNGDTSFVIFPGDDGWGDTTLEKVEFTNSYNKANDNPPTGDNSMMWLWVALLSVSGCGVVTTVLGKKRHSVR